jgi:hypothetical protein
MTAPRCRDRAAQWQSDMYRAATQLMASHPDEADAIGEQVEREIAAGPDFARCHRKSDFMAAPKVNTDRNFVARLMFMADMIERKSYAVRAKGKHGGTLGRSALRLLRVLLYVVNKRDGHLSPSYDTLAKLAQMSRRAVIAAMRVLVTFRFVTIHRRIKRVHTPFGVKVVQATNAYTYHPPTALGAWAWSIFGLRSECTKSTARNLTDRKKEAAREQVQLEGQEPPPQGDQSCGDLFEGAALASG